MGEGLNAFDIPLANLREEGFEQPIFGANYLRGTVDPVGERRLVLCVVAVDLRPSSSLTCVVVVLDWL